MCAPLRTIHLQVYLVMYLTPFFAQIGQLHSPSLYGVLGFPSCRYLIGCLSDFFFTPLDLQGNGAIRGAVATSFLPRAITALVTALGTILLPEAADTP